MNVVAISEPFVLSSGSRMSPGHPFVLSLSKDCLFWSSLGGEGQGFDKLSPNGLGKAKRA